MCGILVWMNKTKKVHPQKFSESLMLLKHRGPDAQRAMFINNLSNGVNRKIFDVSHDKFPLEPVFIGIGHTRLSIIDVKERSHQPFIDERGQYGLVYNGEIYNYLEEKELHLSDHSFKTKSDTEVLFRSLIEHGPRALRTMNGMWAFGFFDFFRNKAIFSRDRYGKKPLFYYRDQENLIFSSEIKSIYKIIGGKRQVDRTSVTGFLMGKMTPQYDDTSTFYNNIKCIPGGAHAEVDLLTHEIVIKRDNLIDPNFDIEPDSEMLPRDLEDAVKLRLRSDVKIGIPLSGGIDSSSIVAHAVSQSESKHDLSLYTVKNLGPNGEIKDDLKYARNFARKLDMPLHEVELPNLDLGNDSSSILMDMTRQYEMPINPFLVSYPLYCMSQKMSNDGIRVTIDGTGGDEIMGGCPASFRSSAICLAKEGRLLSSFNRLNEYNKLTTSSFKNSTKEYLKLLLIYKEGGGQYFSKAQDFVSAKLLPLLNDESLRDSAKWLRDVFFQERVDSSIYNIHKFDIKKFLLPYYLGVTDIFCMSFSLESRSPFLDLNLAKYVNMSVRDKTRHGYNKFLLRKKIPAIVPDNIRWRMDKEGMGFSPKSLNTSNKKEIIDQIVESNLVSEIVDRSKFLNSIDQSGFDDLIVRNLYFISTLDKVYKCELAN